jgi:hypothetical protein
LTTRPIRPTTLPTPLTFTHRAYSPSHTPLQDYIMVTIATVHSISQIKANNARNGYYFFSKGAMRSFNTRVHDAVYGQCVFVTSERNDIPYCAPQPRVYTVRIATDDGCIETYGKSGAYATRSQAHREAKWLGNALRNGTVAYNPETYRFQLVKLLAS